MQKCHQKSKDKYLAAQMHMVLDIWRVHNKCQINVHVLSSLITARMYLAFRKKVNSELLLLSLP